MRAWTVRKEGPAWEVFEREEIPAPTPEDMQRFCLDLVGLRPRTEGEAACEDFVIVRVLAAALATPDLTMASGAYPVPIQRPYVSGQEAVGIVEFATPSLSHLEGRRVMGFTPQPYGSFAERCVMTAPTVYAVPDGWSDEEAAAFVIPSHTAYHAVHRRGRVAEGETVLVLGAAGGVPSAAVQLCAAAGCRVIAVAGGPDKSAWCRELGAHHVIDHAASDFVEEVRALAPEGLDVIVDFVQGEPGQRARPLLAVEGRHLLCGHAGGLLPIHPNEFYVQNWTLIGVCMGYGYGAQAAEIEEEAHRALMGLVAEGAYRPRVGRVIGFEQIPEGLRDLAERRSVGRVVARVAAE